MSVPNFNNFPSDVYAATLTGSNGIIVTGSLSPNKIIVSTSNIPNSSLQNNNIRIGGTTIALGSTATDISGLTSLSVNLGITADSITFGEANSDLSKTPTNNLLSEYEKGTFDTFFETCYNSGADITWDKMLCLYTLVGDVCFININVENMVGTPNGEPFQISRLPFYSYFSEEIHAYQNFAFNVTSGTIGVNSKTIYGLLSNIDRSPPVINFYIINAGTPLQLNDTDLGSGPYSFSLSGWYYI